MLTLVSILDIEFDSLIEYKKSFVNNLRDISLVVRMSSAFKEKEFFIRWLKVQKIDKCYFLINEENPRYIIGDCTIDMHSNFHSQFLNKGAIGCAIRPNERNKHYGTYMLKLLLEKCIEFGMEEVCISCLENNLGSKKIIENNHGLLERKFFDVDGCDIGLKYWVKLNNSEKVYVKK